MNGLCGIDEIVSVSVLKLYKNSAIQRCFWSKWEWATQLVVSPGAWDGKPFHLWWVGTRHSLSSQC